MMRIHHIPTSVTLLMAAVVFSAPLLTNLVLTLAVPSKHAPICATTSCAIASTAEPVSLKRQ